MKSDGGPRNYRKDTLLAHLGRHPEGQHGAVNPPVYHASTILSSNMAEWERKRDPKTRFDVVRYGLLGTPTTFALEEALAAIEGGHRAHLHIHLLGGDHGTEDHVGMTDDVLGRCVD